MKAKMKIENRVPSLELAFRIADAFGVGVEAVFQREYVGDAG